MQYRIVFERAGKIVGGRPGFVNLDEAKRVAHSMADMMRADTYTIRGGAHDALFVKVKAESWGWPRPS